MSSVSFPILTVERQGSDLLVTGQCPHAWLGKSLQDWLDDNGSVRVQHSPMILPAGKGVAVAVAKSVTGGSVVKVLVVEPTARMLVDKGVLQRFSIKLADPVTRNGRLAGGTIASLSLVDRDDTADAQFKVCKSAPDGSPRLINKMAAGSAGPADYGWRPPKVKKRKNKLSKSFGSPSTRPQGADPGFAAFVDSLPGQRGDSRNADVTKALTDEPDDDYAQFLADSVLSMAERGDPGARILANKAADQSRASLDTDPEYLAFLRQTARFDRGALDLLDQLGA